MQRVCVSMSLSVCVCEYLPLLVLLHVCLRVRVSGFSFVLSEDFRYSCSVNVNSEYCK